MEKYVRTAVPQLIADYLTEFREKLIVEFETYFNGQKMHHDDIEKALADIVAKSVGDAVANIKSVSNNFRLFQKRFAERLNLQAFSFFYENRSFFLRLGF